MICWFNFAISVQFKKSCSTKRVVVENIRGLPVDGSIVWCLIGDFDDHSIVFLGINDRSRKHSIDRHNVLGGTEFSDACGLYLIIN